jgi:hypothetical protein
MVNISNGFYYGVLFVVEKTKAALLENSLP